MSLERADQPGSAGSARGDARWADVAELIRLACGPAEGQLEVVVLRQPDPEGSGQSDWASAIPDARVVEATEEEFPDQVHELLERGATVLALPPWGRRPASRLTVEESLILRVAPAPGAFSFLAPGTALSRTTSEFRGVLAQAWTPVTIVEVSGFPGVHPAFDGALVCLRPPANQATLTRFFRVPRGPIGAPLSGELRGLLRRDGGASANGFVLRRALAGDESWAFAAHDPATAAHVEALPGFGSAIRLEDSFEILRTPPGRRADGTEGHRVVSGRSIRRDGTLEPEQQSDADDASRFPVGPELREGDLVVREVSHGTEPLVIGIVGPDVLPVRAGRHVLVVRPRNEAAKVAAHFTLEYLRSPAARAQLRGLSPAGLHVSASGLRQMRVPVPDGPLRDAFEDLRTAERLLTEWGVGAGAVVRAAFEQPSVAQARQHIITTGRLLRQRAEAALLLDDPSHIYSTRYPQPIAIRWSVAVNQRVRGDHEQYVRDALNCYETVLAYAAIVGLALARSRGVDLQAVKRLREDLSRSQGPSLGTWRAVLQELAGRKEARAGHDEGALSDLSAFLVDGGPGAKASKELADRRNDQAHLRSAVDVAQDAAEVEANLAVVMEAAAFLMDLAPIHVSRAGWDALRKENRLEVQRLVGDRAVIPYEKVVRYEPSIETGSLYLDDLKGGLHLLRPYLLRERCPECHAVSTFHIDHDLGDRLRLKSLEDGHVLDYDERSPFEAVGLL